MTVVIKSASIHLPMALIELLICGAYATATQKTPTSLTLLEIILYNIVKVISWDPLSCRTAQPVRRLARSCQFL